SCKFHEKSKGGVLGHKRGRAHEREKSKEARIRRKLSVAVIFGRHSYWLALVLKK
ncbi:hypothetical protein A2U01_0098090, partial [Trifolium medium]|nr:hypothetical protein [Trifolium medium]